MGRTIAYCRVSSRDQNPQLQLDALQAHGWRTPRVQAVRKIGRGDSPITLVRLEELDRAPRHHARIAGIHGGGVPGAV